jgi:hypothetical protein
MKNPVGVSLSLVTFWDFYFLLYLGIVSAAAPLYGHLYAAKCFNIILDAIKAKFAFSLCLPACNEKPYFEVAIQNLEQMLRDIMGGTS